VKGNSNRLNCDKDAKQTKVIDRMRMATDKKDALDGVMASRMMMMQSNQSSRLKEQAFKSKASDEVRKVSFEFVARAFRFEMIDKMAGVCGDGGGVVGGGGGGCRGDDGSVRIRAIQANAVFEVAE
jgi:hypothetical protein